MGCYRGMSGYWNEYGKLCLNLESCLLGNKHVFKAVSIPLLSGTPTNSFKLFLPSG